jgi:hypothetical protein
MLSLRISHECGLGFFLVGEGENTRFGHLGWNEGYVARLAGYQFLAKGAVVMLNSNEGHDVRDEILRAIAVEYEWPGFLEQRKVPIELRPGVVDVYTGEYRTASGVRVEVARLGDALTVRVGDQSPVEMFPHSETGFFATAVNTDVSFLRAERGEATRLVLQQGGMQLVAHKES